MAATRNQITEMEWCPRFNGDNVEGWKHKCEQFFLIDETPDDRKVRYAVIKFDGKALHWYQLYRQISGKELMDMRWDDFSRSTLLQFGGRPEMTDTTQETQYDQWVAIKRGLEAVQAVLSQIETKNAQLKKDLLAQKEAMLKNDMERSNGIVVEDAVEAKFEETPEMKGTNQETEIPFLNNDSMDCYMVNEMNSENMISAYQVFDEMSEPIRDEIEAQFSDIYICESILSKRHAQKIAIHEVKDVIVEMDNSKNFVCRQFKDEFGSLSLYVLVKNSPGEVMAFQSFRDIVCFGDFWGQKSLREGVLSTTQMAIESFGWKPGWILVGRTLDKELVVYSHIVETFGWKPGWLYLLHMEGSKFLEFRGREVDLTVIISRKPYLVWDYDSDSFRDAFLNNQASRGVMIVMILKPPSKEEEVYDFCSKLILITKKSMALIVFGPFGWKLELPYSSVEKIRKIQHDYNRKELFLQKETKLYNQRGKCLNGKIENGSVMVSTNAKFHDKFVWDDLVCGHGIRLGIGKFQSVGLRKLKKKKTRLRQQGMNSRQGDHFCAYTIGDLSEAGICYSNDEFCSVRHYLESNLQKRASVLFASLSRNTLGALIDGAADYDTEQWGRTTEQGRSGSGLGSWSGVIDNIKSLSGSNDIKQLPDVSVSLVNNTLEDAIVAVVQGLALGDGLQVIMDCHTRIAIPRTQLDLYEVFLRVMFSHGGTKLGLSDAIEPFQELSNVLRQWALDITEGGRPWVSSLHNTDKIGSLPEAREIIKNARQLVRPAVPNIPQHQACLEVIEVGIIHGSYANFLQEVKVFNELALLDTTKGFLYIFCTRSAITKLPKVTSVGLKERQSPMSVRLMHFGIATVILLGNINIVFKEVNTEYLKQKRIKTIEASVGNLIAKKKLGQAQAEDGISFSSLESPTISLQAVAWFKENFKLPVTLTSKGHPVHSGQLNINLVDTPGIDLLNPREAALSSTDNLHNVIKDEDANEGLFVDNVTGCWNGFSMQSRITSLVIKAWMCIPMLWVEISVETGPTLLSVSFSLAGCALARFAIAELKIKFGWLIACALEVSHSFGSDDVMDKEEPKNSVRVSTMSIPAIRSIVGVISKTYNADLSLASGMLFTQDLIFEQMEGSSKTFVKSTESLEILAIFEELMYIVMTLMQFPTFPFLRTKMLKGEGILLHGK